MTVVILGATSAIAQETAKCFVADGASLLLVARDAAKLDAVARDLRTRGAREVATFVADLADVAAHEAIARRASDAEVVLIAHGTLQDQRAIDRDVRAQLESFALNADSVLSLAAHFANVLESNGRGTLAVIGSVAGDRGRRNNYTYGAAKAAVHAYCEGLRNRLADSGAHLLLIKPGWVDTPMTAGIKKNPLFASAASVGRGVHHAIRARRATVYLPWFWRWISLVIRALPSKLVKF